MALKRHREIVEDLGPPSDGIDGLRAHFDAARIWWNEGGPAEVQVDDDVVEVDDLRIQVVVYTHRRAAVSRPALIYLHGGGYRLGSPRSNDRQLRELADAWRGSIISVDYAHVPEAVFPTPVEQTALVLRWIASNAQRWGVDGTRLAIGGSSAGANIAAGAALKLGGRRTGFLKAAAFIAGVFDDGVDAAWSKISGDVALFPGPSEARAVLDAYLSDPTHREDPRFNLLRADSNLFPPTFLAAAEVDVFRESSERLARHLGMELADLRVYRGMTHPFFGYSRLVAGSRQCVLDVARFLELHLPSSIEQVSRCGAFG